MKNLQFDNQLLKKQIKIGIYKELFSKELISANELDELIKNTKE